ncbi:ameloblastin isoform X1 [Ochotona princeps]|uniref:ameloblastin isoform X1 n=1 Tax=Ochotona princeps TaxID=9978 RepID=UPI0027154C46|nr:ameloblastin isoform X1 [Ochotona princeps]
MSESKIPLFKMKGLILLLCLLGTSFAVPAFPQQPGTPGMASLSLETMRQLGSLQGLNALSQLSKFGQFGKSLNSLWLHGLLPPPSSFPWMRPREQETQQYEYSLPVHPPPLPSQPSLPPPQPGMKSFLQPTVAPAIQGTPRKGGPQHPMHPGQLPLKDGEVPEIEQQVAPSEKPPNPELPAMDFAGPQVPTVFQIARLIPRGPLPQNRHTALYPGMFYMSYGANQMNAPARLGIMSSEEMPGEGGGPMGYGAIFPRFGGIRQSLGEMPRNPAMGGDFTLEFDTPGAATKGPEKGEGGTQDSPMPETNPSNPANPGLLQEIAHGAHAGLLAFPKDHVPSLAMGPAGQRMGPPRVTPSPAGPLANPEVAEVYDMYGPDMTTPLGFQEESTTDTPMTPNTQEIPMLGNKDQQPQIMRDVWRFPEP